MTPRRHNKKFSAFTLLILTLFITVGIFFTQPVMAATLILSSSTKKVAVGGSITVNVSVNTQSKTINNAEATIFFPADLVEVKSVSSQGSIFSLWVEQPSFSNSNGFVRFNGGVPNPGFTGNSGKAVSISLKAKKAGMANITFSGAAIRENDGLGTNILTGQNSLNIEITSASPEPEKPAEKPKTPEVKTGLAVISSSTHPDQNLWYASTTAIIIWKLPVSADSIQSLIDQFPTSTPNVLDQPPVYQKEISSLVDGIWYFHLRYKTAAGWSDISHYQLHIDSTPPVNLSASPEEKDGKYRLIVKAEDALSGIDYYYIIINNQSPIIIPDPIAANPIDLPLQSLNDNKLIVGVFDKAGNKTETPVNLIAKAKAAPQLIKSYDNILLIIIGLLIIVLLFGCYKLFILKKRLKLSEKKADRAFKLLFEKAYQQIATLEKIKKRQILTNQEKSALGDLKKIITQIQEIKNLDNK